MHLSLSAKTTEEDELVVERLKGLLEGIDFKSGHSLCPSKRVWTCILPNDAKRQLDHIAVCPRFASALRHHQVFAAPTRQCTFCASRDSNQMEDIVQHQKFENTLVSIIKHQNMQRSLTTEFVNRSQRNWHTEDLPSWDLLALAFDLRERNSETNHKNNLLIYRHLLKDCKVLKQITYATFSCKAKGIRTLMN